MERGRKHEPGGGIPGKKFRKRYDRAAERTGEVSEKAELMLQRVRLRHSCQELPAHEGIMPDWLIDRESFINRWEQMNKKMIRIFETYPEGGYSDYDQVLFLIEQNAFTIRQRMADMEEEQHIRYEKKESNPDNVKVREPPVSITVNGSALELRSPATLIRTSTHSWYLAKLARNAIREYVMEHGPLNRVLKKPVHMIIKRKDTQYRRGYRDNENLESTKLINEICRQLGFTDRATNVGYHSLFQLVDNPGEAGTEIIIFSRSDFDRYYHYLNF